MVISAEYLAGFFDGEGHIGFCGRKRHTFQLKLSNCNLQVMQDIQKDWGGRLRERFPEKPQHAISYMLTWSAKQAVPVLNAMLPHLKVKKAEAEFVLNRWNPYIEANNHRRWTPPDYKEKKDELRDEFQLIAKSRRGSYPLQVN